MSSLKTQSRWNREKSRTHLLRRMTTTRKCRTARKLAGEKSRVSSSCKWSQAMCDWNALLIHFVSGRTAIDSQKKKYTVLSPSPGFLPSKVAIAGQIEWVDSE